MRQVTNELVKLLGSNKEAVRQRASEALTDMAADDNTNAKKKKCSACNVKKTVRCANLCKMSTNFYDGKVQADYFFKPEVQKDLCRPALCRHPAAADQCTQAARMF